VSFLKKFKRFIGKRTEIKNDKNKKRKVKYYISREVLETAIAASRDSHPNEFIAMLGGKIVKDKVQINELIFLPSLSGGVSAVIFTDMLPLGIKVLGSIHSHPTPNFYPSTQDLETFSKKGLVHIIIAYPYNESSWRAYNRRGEPINLIVIP